MVRDVEQVCELLVEDLKTGLKSRTVTQSEYGALITEIKNCKSCIFFLYGYWVGTGKGMDVEQVCELLVEDLKTGLKSHTVTQSEY